MLSGNIFLRNKYSEKPMSSLLLWLELALHGCAGGCPGSGEEEEVSLELLKSSFITGKGKNCLHDYTSSISAELDKWHSGSFISPGCCDLLDDAWRDASS